MFYGIGAQKAATTWLARMLSLTPGCHVAPGKELHYWTMLEEGADPATRVAARRRWVRRGATDVLGSLRTPHRTWPAVTRLRFRMTTLALARDPSPEHYARRILRRWRGQPVVGELTPGYALLGQGSLRRMAALHSDTRMIFILRDPVERMWSGIRHAGRSRGGSDRTERLLTRFDRALADPNDRHRRASDYAATLAVLDEAVPADRTCVLFFESLRTRDELDRLSAFLGIGEIPLRAGRRLNRGSDSDVQLDDGRRARARDTFAPVYRDIARRFGDAVPAEWREAPR